MTSGLSPARSTTSQLPGAEVGSWAEAGSRARVGDAFSLRAVDEVLKWSILWRGDK